MSSIPCKADSIDNQLRISLYIIDGQYKNICAAPYNQVLTSISVEHTPVKSVDCPGERWVRFPCGKLKTTFFRSLRGSSQNLRLFFLYYYYIDPYDSSRILTLLNTNHHHQHLHPNETSPCRTESRLIATLVSNYSKYRSLTADNDLRKRASIIDRHLSSDSCWR